MKLRDLKVFLSILYFSGIIYLTFFTRRRRHSYEHLLNLAPFKVFRDYKEIGNIGPFNFYSNIFGNIVLFLPLPFIFALTLRITKFSTILLLSFILSFTIELLQYFFEVGVADVDDIILNVTGAAVGYFLYKFFLKYSNIHV